ncbi:polysaccharide deacetylase family protein [Novosphingobium sp. 1949]|uniref:Polysaccharide deacetylase family protein n=1 Tax=Novosphingobium organovorum TaxID=2930092 RepID=A0ABT0BBQ3_9SPHN|nr:polysaccharide deacetylase family protein [Novosphingobium organovorum]MCJ2182486.1 polysaccharide deacetylase family protein [Novosphingobium organovorum]
MPAPNLLDPPSDEDRALFHADFGQRFLITVDTEEEFDWDAPLDREGHTVLTVPALRKFQEFCEGFGIVPVYLVDWPVANSPLVAQAIGEAVRQNRAEVGIQLHPWVSPPFDEDVTAFNSFAGNLPIELERAKLLRLKERIETVFSVAPLIYRAGRYGLGPHTAAILQECGIAIDSSVRARFDYSAEGGPNYRDHPLTPYWSGGACQLLELPLTTIYWGPLRRLGDSIYPRLWRTPRLRGILARLKLLERIALTPEGITCEEAIRGVEVALDDGLPVLVFSFHSPSLAPGHTPYVRDEDDLDALYDWWRALFEHLTARGVRPTSVSQIMNGVVLP